MYLFLKLCTNTESFSRHFELLHIHYSHNDDKHSLLWDKFIILIKLLPVHSKMQHFGVGGGSETFGYLKLYKRQTINVSFSLSPASLILAKNPLTVHVSYIINDFRCDVTGAGYPCLTEIQYNFNGSNSFGTMKIYSRRGSLS